MALSSYNQFHNNCARDAIIVGICNSLTSVFAGLVVFAILGNLAKGADFSTVVTVGKYFDKLEPNILSPNQINDNKVTRTFVFQQSTGLAFIAIPEATLDMDIPQLWSFLFFFMMVNLALSSICRHEQIICIRQPKFSLIAGFRPSWPLCWTRSPSGRSTGSRS